MACIILVCRTSLDIHVLAEAGVDSIRDGLYNTCVSNVFRRTCISEAGADHSMSGPIFQCSPLGVNDF